MNREKNKTIRRILGTMTFGNQVDLKAAEEMIRVFLDDGNREIDTAYLYTGGRSEEILGSILPDLDRDSFSIATKAAPRVKGNLRPEALEEPLQPDRGVQPRGPGRRTPARRRAGHGFVLDVHPAGKGPKVH